MPVKFDDLDQETKEKLVGKKGDEMSEFLDGAKEKIIAVAKNKKNQGAALGAGLGAGLGYSAGRAISKEGSKSQNGVIGGLIGGVLGAITGYMIRKDKNEG